MILAHFIGKKNGQNRRTPSAPRRGLPKTRARDASHDVSAVGGARAGGSSSLVAFISRSDRPGARRTRSCAGPSTSIFRFARGCRWQCFAVAQIPLATTGAIRRVRRIVRSRSPGLHQRGGSCRAKSFLNALLRSAAPLAEQRQRGRRQRHATIDREGATRHGSKAADRALASIRGKACRVRAGH